MKAKKLLAEILSAATALSALAVFPAVTADADVLVSNSFEQNYDGWFNLGTETALTATPAAAHASQRGMAVTNRQSADDGAASEKGFYLEGGTAYDYSLFVKADTDEHFKLTLTWRYADNTTESAVIAEKNCKAGEWTKLSCKYQAPDDTVNLTLTLTTDSTNDFYFDDVQVTGKNRTYSQAELTAKAADLGLKDIYANHFRFGTCMPSSALYNSTITGIILREFNSVTCENELKPDSTLVQTGSTNDNINVSLNSAAGIIDFCINNNIAMRGHTFVWHSQTPSWFFKTDFANGNWVDKDTMNRRMESYIKNMFEAIETQYPSLNLYAYDVCNECIKDGGGVRQAGDNNQNSGTSAWVSVYGDNSFVKQAFTYAKKYRPEGCKLFYNDYNEYEGQKHKDIVSLVTDLKQADLIDGVGMQSHLEDTYPDNSTYRNALNTFADITGCVHITELDIKNAPADKYAAIMQCALDNPAVEAFVVWGTTDDTSWRSGAQCLLFDGSGNKKDAYTKLASMIDPSDYGDGDNPVTGGKTITPIEADESGCYFRNTFETGTDTWSGRGSASTAQSTAEAYEGSGSLYVTGRTDNWNGGSRSISSNPFAPGGTYSFGAMVKYTEGDETEELKLTMQYSLNGEDVYDQVDLKNVKKGEWTLLSNDSFEIPAGATGMLLYVEAPKSLIDFYIDEAYGGVQGANPIAEVPAETTTTITTTETTVTEPIAVSKRGDVDCNGDIEVMDAIMLARIVAEDGTVKVTDTGKANADTDASGKVDAADLSTLLQYLAGQIKTL